MKGYKATVIESSMELNVKERIAIKDTSDAVKIDEATQEQGEVIIHPWYYAVIGIHNDNVSENGRTDYEVFVIMDTNGTKYYTSSEAFWTSFKDIVTEIEAEGGDIEYAIKAYRKPSKNFKGKDFLTCSIA